MFVEGRGFCRYVGVVKYSRHNSCRWHEKANAAHLHTVRYSDGREEQLSLAELSWKVLLLPRQVLPPTTSCTRRFQFSQIVDKSEGDFDRGGVFYHIATEGGTAPWVNPAAVGRVAVTWSSVDND
eukprot:COSAG05_NODE_14177_length_405_cov_0.915033_1_plen_124_part_01